MARFVVFVLALSLALVPAVAAQEPDRGETTPFAGWFDALSEAVDWLFGWVPAWSAPPDGGDSTMRSAPRKTGAYIEPSGLTARPGLSSNPSRRGARPTTDG